MKQFMNIPHAIVSTRLSIDSCAKSSANVVILVLAKEGISRSEARGEDLRFVYGTHTKLSGREGNTTTRVGITNR